jgi:energy-coupling factor transporter ATP-binding protein EcfA2
VLGPSGSGKSTLALAIGGLVPNERPGEWTGRLTVDGLDVRTAPRAEVSRRVGVVFQDPASQLVMDRVEDDVAFGLENHGWPLAEMGRRVPEALAGVGLAGLERAQTQTLSGGQQQRLALAGALAPMPGVLVLDEPTANLDADGARAFATQLAGLHDARSATLVLIEHRVELAWPLADLVLVLGRDGRPIACARPEALDRTALRAIANAGVWLPAELDPSAESLSRGAPRRSVESAARKPAPAVLAAQGAEYAYEPGRPVVRDLDLTIRAGERVALVGPNASGKSTLSRLLVGLLRPSRGTVRLLDAEPHRLSAARLARRAGYVFQNPEQQFLADRVVDEISLGLGDEERAAAFALLESLALPLERFGERSPYTLSGGEQRRLSVACALVRAPAMLVLDEPTFGQDRAGYVDLFAILEKRVDLGAAVLAATHDLRFAGDFAERILTMRDGRIVDDRSA